jgi:hypothetical protein
MTDFEKRIPEDETMIEEWPNPEEDYGGDYDDEDDWDDYVDDEGPQDYEVKFKLKGVTEEEVNTISRYLFDAITKELEISYDKLEGLEIEED